MDLNQNPVFLSRFAFTAAVLGAAVFIGSSGIGYRFEDSPLLWDLF